MLGIMNAIFTMSTYFITYASFKDFGNYASKGNGSVVFNTVFIPFFVDRYNIC